MHESIRKYVEKKLRILPVEARGKQPLSVDGGRFKWKDAQLPAAAGHWDASPIPNVGLHLTDHIEVDPDHPEAARTVEAAFQQHPTRTWGRSGRPHKRLYRSSAPGPISVQCAFFDRSDKRVVTIEVKSGAEHYTVIPPGAHASGERIAWENELRTATVDPAWCVAQARRVNLLCLLAHYWNEGNRNTLAIALMRVFVTLVGMDPNAAAATVGQVAALCGDTEHRTAEALAAWGRHERGGKMYGLPTIETFIGRANTAIFCEALGIDDVSDWPEPVDVTAPGTTAAQFPADLLPEGPMRDWALDIAKRQSAPLDGPAMSLIVTCATAVGTKVRVQPKQLDTGWTEVLLFYLGYLANSGEGKSPTMDENADLLVELHLDAREQFAAALDAYRERAKAAKTAKEDFDEESPQREHLIVNEATREALEKMLPGAARGFLYYADELRVVSDGMNQYKSSGNDDAFYLKNWSAKFYSKQRASDKSVTVEVTGTGFSIMGGLQPGVVRSLLNGTNRRSGFIARFLFVYPDPPTGDLVDAPVSGHQQYVRHWLAAARNEFQLETRLVFDPDATAMLLAWGSGNRRRVMDAHEKEHRSKWMGYIARLAAILSLMELVPEFDSREQRWFFSVPAGEVGLSDSVPARIVKRVIDWLETYELPTIQRVHGLLDEHPGREDAAKVACWLRVHQIRDMTLGDVTRKAIKGISVARAEAAMDCLEWAAIVEIAPGGSTPKRNQVSAGQNQSLSGNKTLRNTVGKTGSRGGRPTVRYRVNPRWLHE